LENVLSEAGRLANAGRFADALEVCERSRGRLTPAPELFFLMGMLHQSSGDLDRAEGCFHKTLYLDADHEEALLALALVARQRGDAAMAEKYRQSAARALARKERAS
jgi:chemotaxis protein methyltransferase WspC